MENGKIKFKPLHEGMGFHPFSDGLPYAPESKSKPQMGAGATAAGRPRFTTQIPPQVRPQLKTARQLQNPSISSATAIRTATPSRAIQTTPKVMPASEPSLLRQRSFAYLLDSVIHASFWIGTNLAALFLFQFQIDFGIVKDSLPQFLVFFLFSQWIFIGLQEVLFENTIGKAFFQLEFQRNHKSLFLRSMVFMTGILCFGLGLYFRPQDRLGKIQLKQKIQTP
ncbi:MAG: RDD family protein [Bdellovibrionales bacterium]|nr:RDD family protein [Bdellovibrionales bacterium]